MTEDFKRRVENACEKAKENSIINKENKQYKMGFNKVYADLYTDLVISFIDAYDFYTSSFNIDLVDKEILSKLGTPRDISACIDYFDGDTKGRIVIDYGKENAFGRKGEPDFKKDEKFDLKVINGILKENNLRIDEIHNEIDRYSCEKDIITFDASILIKTREIFLSNEPKLTK